MWVYQQSTGYLACNGLPVGVGYSGQGPGFNNPLKEGDPTGPIPRGQWTISPAHGIILQMNALALTPVAFTAYGRTGFYLRTDTRAADDAHGVGSIVLPQAILAMIHISGDLGLTVIH